MNKKGFTLIEIIAVIVILGVIMLIAVPSVTHQIMLSRKSAYVTNVKSFLEVADGSYREYDYGEYLEEKEILIAPLNSLNMDAEVLKKSPFAAYDSVRCYIVIKPTTNNFKSYAIVRDTANYGIVALPREDITKDSIQTTNSGSIQSITDFYTCSNGEVILNTEKSFVFMGVTYFATDYELLNSDKCDNNNKPVIRFSNTELENGDVYTVNFDNNTGEGVMNPIQCIFGRDCTLSENTFTKTGYHFTKWTKSKNGRGVSYVNKQTVKNITFLDHITLFAQWAINSNTLVVNASGGTGGGTWKQDYNTKKTVDVKKTGYTFNTWSSTGECGTYANTAKTTYKFPPGYETTCKLTANWNINSSTLIVDANGGNGGCSAVSQNYNTTKSISVNRTGYTFTGWESSGTCGSYANNATTTYTFPPDDGVTCTLKAKWKINTSKLVVNANGGTGGFSAVTQDYNTTKSISVDRTGYTFDGWDHEGTCGTYGNTATTTYTYPANNGTTCTLKAKWKINTNKLSVDANGGTGGFTATSGNYNSTKSIDVQYPNYKFTGWTKSSDCGSLNPTDNQTTTYTYPPSSGTTCTLKANWRIFSSTLVVNSNGGTGDINATQNYNTTKSINVSRTGYTFSNWSNSGICGTYDNSATSTYTYPSSDETTCTLKANWTINRNTITIDANGGTGGGSWTKNYGSTTSISVSRTNYKFNGWSQSGTCGTVGSGASFTYTHPANSGTICKLTANWLAIQKPTLTLSSTSVTITPSVKASCSSHCSTQKGSKNITVSSSVSNGTYSFSASPNIVSASISGNKVTITQKSATGSASATATLTITFTPNSSEYAPVSKNVSVTVNYCKNSPSEQYGPYTACSWEHPNSTTCHACRCNNTKGGYIWGTCACD